MKTRLFFLAILLSIQLFAHSELHLVSIGNYTTTGGEIIQDCKIGYRILGKFNAGKSNIVLWPTWYTGTSDVLMDVVPKIVDTTKFALIIIDALGNNVSSSPSNTNGFPTITIRDMVNSQHELLVKYLNINHVYAVGGISMGAMQTLEWLVAYPTFMDKAISIVGTPKQSFHDMLLWNTELELIKQAEKKGDKGEIELTRKRVADIQMLKLFTPNFFLRTQSADSIYNFLSKTYAAENYNISNLRVQLEAMMKQDIYKSSGKSPAEIKELIKARVLIIVALQDQMVNPYSSMELSKQISCELVTIDNDCGHNLLECGTEQVEKVIHSFLEVVQRLK